MLISWFTANVPQYVQDICLEIAIDAEDNKGNIDRQLFIKSLRSWIQEALVGENTRLEKNTNARSTKQGRRNQVIYTAGNINNSEFSANEIERSLRIDFPISIKNKNLNISQILIELSKGDHRILKKTPNGTEYRFLDPKIRIMIRWMFEKDENEEITIKKFDETIKFQ